VDPRGILVEINFEVILDRLNEIGMDVSRIQQIADLGLVSAPSGSAHSERVNR
jgi:hypothetical protein